ncbi:MAG: hypothetical protein KC713_09580, partial [Candidatus Omnitrophica bacterium]|nr:hypothetical protein [Candidatus Omnitrophota bacterium]
NQDIAPDVAPKTSSPQSIGVGQTGPSGYLPIMIFGENTKEEKRFEQTLAAFRGDSKLSSEKTDQELVKMAQAHVQALVDNNLLDVDAELSQAIALKDAYQGTYQAAGKKDNLMAQVDAGTPYQTMFEFNEDGQLVSNLHGASRLAFGFDENWLTNMSQFYDVSINMGSFSAKQIEGDEKISKDVSLSAYRPKGVFDPLSDSWSITRVDAVGRGLFRADEETVTQMMAYKVDQLSTDPQDKLTITAANQLSFANNMLNPQTDKDKERSDDIIKINNGRMFKPKENEVVIKVKAYTKNGEIKEYDYYSDSGLIKKEDGTYAKVSDKSANSEIQYYLAPEPKQKTTPVYRTIASTSGGPYDRTIIHEGEVGDLLTPATFVTNSKDINSLSLSGQYYTNNVAEAEFVRDGFNAIREKLVYANGGFRTKALLKNNAGGFDLVDVLVQGTNESNFTVRYVSGNKGGQVIERGEIAKVFRKDDQSLTEGIRTAAMVKQSNGKVKKVNVLVKRSGMSDVQVIYADGENKGKEVERNNLDYVYADGVDTQISQNPDDPFTDFNAHYNRLNQESLQFASITGSIKANNKEDSESSGLRNFTDEEMLQTAFSYDGRSQRVGEMVLNDVGGVKQAALKGMNTTISLASVLTDEDRKRLSQAFYSFGHQSSKSGENYAGQDVISATATHFMPQLDGTAQLMARQDSIAVGAGQYIKQLMTIDPLKMTSLEQAVSGNVLV